MSEFNKHVGKKISKEKAEGFIKNWKKTKIKTEKSFFGADVISEMLNRGDVVGIWINYGMDDEGYMKPVLTPQFDTSKTTTLSADKTATKLDDPVDESLGCPPYCPK
jgi:hypothetical protein